MWPVKGVVVGYDGSADSRAALAWAAHESARRDVPLTVVHAGGDVAVIPGPMPDEPPDPRAFSVAADGAALARRLESDRDLREVEVIGVTSAGDAGSVLLTAGAGADLLVLGSGGRRRIAPRHIGTVAWEVAHHATCPVVIVSAGYTPSGGVRGSVVACVDGSPESTAAAHFAADVADLWGAKLHLVAAYPSAVDAVAAPRTTLALEKSGEPAFDTSSHHLAWDRLVAAEVTVAERHPELSIQLETLEGDPVPVLAALSGQAGLLVLGRHAPPADVEHPTPDVTGSVLARARCPIAVVPSPRPVAADR